MSKYTTSEIEGIWSESTIERTWDKLWEIHAASCPPTSDSFTDSEKLKMKELMGRTEHEVVRRLVRRAIEGENPNQHLGLTSSDVTDNARVMLCQQSAMSIFCDLTYHGVGLIPTIQSLGGAESDLPVIPAFTHLLPAKTVSAGDYRQTWVKLLREIEEPNFRLRGFRGSVGDGHAGHPVSRMLLKSSDELSKRTGQGLEPTLLLQTWSPLSAHEILAWITRVCLILNKIAQDARYLAVLGVFERLERDTTASSTLTHKWANPANFERCLALCRRTMADVTCGYSTLLTQGLSRTLDDSAVWREILPEMWGWLAYVLEVLRVELPKWRFKPSESIYDEELKSMNEVLLSEGKISRMRADFRRRNIL